MTFADALKKPSAYLPVAMSCAALILVLFNVLILRATRQADEGTAAHIWQLLMAGQIPIIIFFAVRWLSRIPKDAMRVLVLQACAGLAALAPVYFFKL